MPQRRCPRCTNRILEPSRHGEVEIDFCVECRGLWFDAGELAHTLQQYDADLAPSGSVADSVGTLRRDSSLACPACRARMKEYDLSKANPVAVDVCPSCRGVWLDRNELVQAQAGHHFREARERIEEPTTARHWLFQLLSSLPVEFNLRPRKRPFVTMALVAINCAAFLWQYTFDDWTLLFDKYGLVPERAGTGPWFSQLWTHAFLHGNPIHLFGNMYFLWILGDNVEDVLGHWRYLGFYVLVLLGGGLVISFSPLDPEMPRVGASGAVSGVMAAYLIIFRRSMLTFMFFLFQFKVPAGVYITIWLVFNVAGLVTATPGVAWLGHLGGFVVGAAIALVAYPRLLRGDPLLRLLNESRAVGIEIPWGK